ncbi:MAG: PIN domain protein [Candidatus Omnitrophica bacterium]|nr:PIN domain protein [Candidatus Omnitrophota bacterium]MCA9449461.1 PIN domain protein [Candidatus Omnitrophota bacterium]MCB9767637.1 PIN domain protein [Candidatus Omnitrophota bacterium]
MRIYVDASVVGGCEDIEFSQDSIALWRHFIEGVHTLMLSAHTLRELEGAPSGVRDHLLKVPIEHQIVLEDSEDAAELAEAYLEHGVVGPGSKADALHVALATLGHASVLVSWNFKHIVNLGRIRQFNAVNVSFGYGILEIRTPKEVLDYGE